MWKSYVMGIFSFLMMACSDKAKSSLPGTYINQSAGEYSRAFDTLVITPDEGNSYSIERRVSFQRFRHGKFESKEC